MANLTITNVEVYQVELDGGRFRDGTFTVTAATYKKGTILAIDSSTLKYVPFVKGGVTNENGIPKAVLTYEIVSTGAGDVAVRPLVEGRVRQRRLVIQADGDATNVDEAVVAQLRDYGITPIEEQELGVLDNQ